MIGQHRTPHTKLWMKKTYNPYFDLIKNGTVWFDERLTQDDFTPKAGDWVVFQLWSEKPRKFLKKQELKAVNLVRNTAEVPFWKKCGCTIGFTIMALRPPLCPECEHIVFLEYDEEIGASGRVFDTSYFTCDANNILGEDCPCRCDDHVDLHYEVT